MTVVMPLSKIKSADKSMPATGRIGPVSFSMTVRPAVVRSRSRSARTTALVTRYTNARLKVEKRMS